MQLYKNFYSFALRVGPIASRKAQYLPVPITSWRTVTGGHISRDNIPMAQTPLPSAGQCGVASRPPSQTGSAPCRGWGVLDDPGASVCGTAQTMRIGAICKWVQSLSEWGSILADSTSEQDKDRGHHQMLGSFPSHKEIHTGRVWMIPNLRATTVSK